MFYPERIKNIKPNDRVLEVGPGSKPYKRSDVLLEKNYSQEEEYKAQIAYTKGLKTKKEVFYYDGGKFPFSDKEFDYVICSHVLEHVDDLDFFVSEIIRVGKNGYFEFPTIYYDYIYDFPMHISFVFYKDETICWMPKSESTLRGFKDITGFFYLTLERRYNSLVGDLHNYFFQGFEWFDDIKTKRVYNISEVCFDAPFTIAPKKHGVFPI